MTNFNEWSKIGLAFTVGVALSAGYVALGTQASPAPTVIIEERCSEQTAPAPQPPEAPTPAVELTGTPLDWGMSQGQLDTMARFCEVHDDRPQPLDDALAADLGLSDKERRAYERAYTGLRGKGVANHFMFLNDLDPSIDIKDLSDDEKLAKINELALATKTDADRSLFRHMAEERAGKRKLPSERHLARSSIWAQWQRSSYATGDEFAELLARDLDVARVNELRAKFGGWPGGVVTQRGCEDVPMPQADAPKLSTNNGPYKQIVARVVRAHLGSVRGCYEEALKTDPALAGKLVVDFTILGETGKASEAAVDHASSITDTTMRQCVIDDFNSWIFPKPQGGGNVHISYPLMFAPNP